MTEAIYRMRLNDLENRRKIQLALPFIVYAAGIVVELIFILIFNGGKFTYTLDDTYIHMALAENIAQGHYGVNLGEASAPASSILWPFLLAPFHLIGLGDFAPLWLNLAAAIGILLVANRLWQIILAEDRRESRPFVIGWLTVLTGVFANLVGLVFLGMEHGIQVWLALTILLGMILVLEEKSLPWWLLPAVICAPLIRYECLALSLPALLYLFSRGYRLAALIGGMAIVILLSVFSGSLLQLGLAPIPTSIQAKSDLAAQGLGSGLTGPLFHLRDSLNDRRGILVASTLIFLGYGVIARQQRPGVRLLAAAIGITVLLHLTGGSFGGYHRYEIYIWCYALLGTAYILRIGLTNLLTLEGSVRFLLLATFATGIWNLPYLNGLFTIPYAANNIYEQHYQMHRFATEFYPKPVAINDLGYVAYQNDNYVLDLRGLASQEALNARAVAVDAEWIVDLSERHDVALAMIYDYWFPQRPENWELVGELHLGRKRITPAGDIVAFYATAESREEVLQAARLFRESLPAGVVFELAETYQ